MSSDLRQFGLTEMLRCSTGIRRATKTAATVESVARKLCTFLRDEFVNEDDATADDGGRQCALVRMYVTLPYRSLDRSTRLFADRLLGTHVPGPELRCLCLMGTAGRLDEWNDRRASRGHQAIPLPSPKIVEQAPMIAQLVRQFGLDLEDVVEPKAGMLDDMSGRTYGVFHVEEAAGSPYIPAQDFVKEHGISSVVGVGGSMRSGDIFAVILFTRVPIRRDVADRFRSLALDLKSALFMIREGAVFDATSPS